MPNGVTGSHTGLPGGSKPQGTAGDKPAGCRARQAPGSTGTADARAHHSAFIIPQPSDPEPGGPSSARGGSMICYRWGLVRLAAA